ncbi:MAG: hypothetical protein ICV87_08325 [Gemmatimonadetes bacterium]|nr:hypothetical protein [Gemmatimonadota bacterium]
MKLSALLLPAIVLASALPLHAQEAGVSWGDRVRVATAARPPVCGTVVRVDSAGLAIRSATADTVFTPWRDVQRVDLSRGRSPGRSAVTMGGVGLALGAVGGAALGNFVFFDETVTGDECLYLCTRRQTVVFSASTFGFLGAAVGSAVGAIFPPERWRSTRVPVRITVAPGDGVLLGARVEF